MAEIQLPEWKYLNGSPETINLTNAWKLHFELSNPQVKSVYSLNSLTSWTNLNNDTLRVNAGTGIYETDFNLNQLSESAIYVLNLGDVRESAHVFVNGKDAGIVWAAPFGCRISKYLKTGVNNLRIEVTNLPANRIADYDRRNINWRIFNEINIVDINYQKSNYSNWLPMESGLCSPVSISVFK